MAELVDINIGGIEEVVVNVDKTINDFVINVSGTGGGEGISDHALLQHLTYDTSGHIGFASSADLLTLSDALDSKVDKETGKGLSSNDYTIADKNKLAGIQVGAEVNVNADWNSTSGDSQILNKPTIPTKTSDLTNDSGFISTEVDPVFVASPAHSITTQDISNWNSKQNALGYNPVTDARTFTINGITYDLTANRSWTVGDILSTSSYSNPSWITALAWSKISGAPSFITSASISTLTDVLLTSLTTGDLLKYNGTKWINTLLSSSDIPNLDMSKITTGNLSWSRISSTPTTLLGYGISYADTLFDNKYQATLPPTPVDPSKMYLNGNLQWAEIAIGSGGNASNIYFSLVNSDVSGYRTLTYTPDSTETQYSNSITNTESLFITYLGPLQIGVTVINAGTWSFSSYIEVDKTTGTTQLKYEPFVRHLDGSETTLFSIYSDPITTTAFKQYTTNTTQNAFTVVTTDRLGVRIYGKTTSSAAVSITRIVGDGRGAYFTTSLPLRHTQLRSLNDDLNNQHVTSTQILNWNNSYNFTSNYSTNYPDLTAIEALSGTSGLLKKTATNSWTLDTSNYLTGITSSQITTALGYTPESVNNKGVANGYVPLGSDSKISTTYLPSVVLGAMKYQGVWDASTGNYPTLPAQGNYWVVSVAGTINSVAYKVGDWLAYNGSSWNKIDNGQTVSSVFGRVGAISATNGDYNTDQVTEGSNKYYTDARSRSALTLTNSGSGAATYNQLTGVLNIPTYANQTITLSGDITGSGSTSINTTLANSGVTPGTYNNSSTSITPITFDAKGRATGTGSAVTITPAWSSVTGKPTFATVATSGSYTDLINKPTIPAAQVNSDWSASTGIAQILNKPTSLPASDVYAWAKASTKPTYTASEVGAQPAFSNGTGFLKNNGSGTWSYDNNSYYLSSNPSGYIKNGDNCIIFNEGSTLWLKGTSTTSIAASTWNPQLLTYQAWGQAFKNNNISSDSGDIVFWLRPSQYSSNTTELNVSIDGDFYAGEGQYKVWHAGNLTNNNQLSNGAGYITGINSSMVTNALGYTPYNSSNPSGYITTSALSGYATQSWVSGNYFSQKNGDAVDVNNYDYYKNSGGKLFGAPNAPYPYYSFFQFGDGPYVTQFNGTNNSLKFRSGGDSGLANFPWVEILHSSNYTSYCATPDGSNTSGTWGISITGNSNKANHLTLQNIGSPDQTGFNGIYYCQGGSTPTPSGVGDGTLIASSYIGSSDQWGSQIYQDYRAGYLYVRGRNNSSWSNWLRVIDSSNIGSQSVANATNWSGSSSLGTLAYKSPTGSAAGKVLTATDGSNNCTWQTPTVTTNNITPQVYNVTNSFNLISYPVGSVIYVYSNSDITVTLPNQIDAGTYLFNGATITVCRAGSGNVTFVVAGSTPTPITSINGYTKIADRGTMVAATLNYDTLDEPSFFLIGNLSN